MLEIDQHFSYLGLFALELVLQDQLHFPHRNMETLVYCTVNIHIKETAFKKLRLLILKAKKLIP